MEELILKEINSSDIDSLSLAKKLNIDHNELIGKLKSLESKEYIKLNLLKKDIISLTTEGESYSKNGMPEFQLLNLINKEEGTDKTELETKLGAMYKIAFSTCMKKKMIKLTDSKIILLIDPSSLTDTDKELLVYIANGESDKLSKTDLTNLKKRKLVEAKSVSYFNISKGDNFSLEVEAKITDITSDMIINKTYKDIKFSKFNLNAKGADISMGAAHPLLKVRTEFRSILLEMGFSEMPTNNFVESSFWNFDSLFQPQQHPARDSHDTFFLNNPKYSNIEKFKQYFYDVKKMHEEGGYGSFGWKYNWSEEEARKNILRTHTTATSSKMLKQIADNGFKEAKLFSIDRVFRNETLDATHLAEFHQIEGLVCGKNLGLGHLKGIITEFFRKVGITELKFKPAYNPYTEPSMEIFVYHPALKKTIEIGNSGIFRPEMLRPMGLPEECSVIAWGLSLERPTMIQYNINNIRELFGHKIDIKDIKNNPICAFNN